MSVSSLGQRYMGYGNTEKSYRFDRSLIDDWCKTIKWCYGNSPQTPFCSVSPCHTTRPKRKPTILVCRFIIRCRVEGKSLTNASRPLSQQQRHPAASASRCVVDGGCRVPLTNLGRTRNGLPIWRRMEESGRCLQTRQRPHAIMLPSRLPHAANTDREPTSTRWSPTKRHKGCDAHLHARASYCAVVNCVMSCTC